ncbi:MAG: 50S ribosomal protein L22 [Candidatus Kapabacteria bacterium]|jgi:large subunit ribosomal protein L22|nr:50S ribosomal protein L22 [Candidatus Kapabacteria bacterium]
MEARAVKRYNRSSPRKMRLVVDLIRGKSAAQALNLLRFSDKMAAAAAELTLKSAISNLQNKDAGVDPESIYVKECFVDGGPTLKRISPAPMGRAYRIRKRSHHLTIVVSVKQ